MKKQTYKLTRSREHIIKAILSAPDGFFKNRQYGCVPQDWKTP
jgi:Fe2+ or Zn2+ uptake regulation protein